MTPTHPGTIVFVDAERGTEEARDAATVPESIRFADTPGGRVAVVRIVSAQRGDRLVIRSYDAEGNVVSSTLQEPRQP